MIRSLFRAAFLVAFSLSAGQAHADDPLQFSQALRAADRGEWDAALAGGRAAGPSAEAVIEWRYLREADAPTGAYVNFFSQYGDWPGLKLMRKKGEASIAPDTDPGLVVAFFGGQVPQTGDGSLALARALRAQGNAAAAEEEAIRGWRNVPMSDATQAAYLDEFGGILKKHHDGRMAAMLWLGALPDAKRMLPLVSDNTRAVALARIALQEDGDGIDALLQAVPAKMAGSSGLAYDRFIWRISKDKYAEAEALLLERSESADSLGNPEAWADWRRKLARKEMREGDPRLAYKLASRHHLKSGDAFEDLEWLSGYIALRKLGDAKLALKHFDRYAAIVSGPISLGRAGYWRGRALEALGRDGDAAAAYAEGARYQTSFYGLLAAEKVGLPLSPAMVGGEIYPSWKGADFANSSVFQAARALMAAHELQLAARFMLHLGEPLSGEDMGRLAGAAIEAGHPYVAVTLAKAAADKGVVWPSAYFPLVGLDHLDLPVPTELTLAIARRESEFNPGAHSPAGAMGLMQVMPETGREMAGRIGLPYNEGKMASDFDYNARVGSAYLAELVGEFGTSPLLIATGYNAGPGRARKWLALLGDPRSEAVDPVDWVESIPFRETQTYVMRVAESLPIYRARLSGQTGQVNFTALLKGR